LIRPLLFGDSAVKKCRLSATAQAAVNGDNGTNAARRTALSAEHVKSFLIAQGITLILQATADKNKEKTDVAIAKMRLAITFAEALLAIGAFNKAGMKEAEAYGLKLCRAIRDFYASEDFQTLIRFFAQRAPCACLDLEVKKVDHQPKMGLCCACHQSMEFQALMKCTQCKVAHCCSRACQVANWSLHKNFCQKVSKSHCEKRNRANAILGQRTNRSSGATRRRPGNSRGRRGLLAIVFACEISRRATSKGDHVGWNASAAACQILIRHPDTIPQCCCARCHSAAWFVQ